MQISGLIRLPGIQLSGHLKHFGFGFQRFLSEQMGYAVKRLSWLHCIPQCSNDIVKPYERKREVPVIV